MAGEKNRPKGMVWQDVRPSVVAKNPNTKKRRQIVFVLPSLPKIKIPKKIKARLNTRRRRIVAVIILALIFAAVLSWYFLFERNHAPKYIPSAKITLTKGTPNYTTILPDGKSSSELGGWTRVSPPTSNAVYAYVDKIGKVQVDVSEQPLPDGFKNNIEAQVQQIAEAEGASEKITVGAITVHIGTYDKGTQRAIFSKNNLLLLITSASTISNNDWATYINTLN
ncbi:MAG: hypothetical protein JWN26_211 [Candidatus Saccharibacteria bacterium]|nr:hypothetical protein [Candidatus Saccharibacteria bacterium]